MSDEVLHIDDVSKPANLTAEEYQAQHEQRAAELGDEGLHVIPPAILAQIGGSSHE